MLSVPPTNHSTQIDISQNHKDSDVNMCMMLEVYKSVIDTDEVFYCSSPITSGKRYLNWLERIGKNFADIDSADKTYHQHHYQEVIEPNRQQAQKFIQQLRHKTGKIVIDPTAIPHIPDWTQRDWHYFWQQVIERYITTAFFINDWQYSNGCVYEFWIAKKKGIPTFNEDHKKLEIELGISLIRQAILQLKERKGNICFIEEILSNLEKL